jgi:hypothetical protein
VSPGARGRQTEPATGEPTERERPRRGHRSPWKDKGRFESGNGREATQTRRWRKALESMAPKGARALDSGLESEHPGNPQPRPAPRVGTGPGAGWAMRSVSRSWFRQQNLEHFGARADAVGAREQPLRWWPERPGPHDRDASRERSRRGWSGSSRERMNAFAHDPRGLATTRAPSTRYCSADQREARGPPREAPGQHRPCPGETRGGGEQDRDEAEDPSGPTAESCASERRQGSSPGDAASAARGRGREPESPGGVRQYRGSAARARRGVSPHERERERSSSRAAPRGSRARRASGRGDVRSSRRLWSERASSRPVPTHPRRASVQGAAETGPSPQQVRVHARDSGREHGARA